MYSDIYSKLSPDERKILENYHQKLSQSSSKTSLTISSSQSKRPASSKNQISKNSSVPTLKKSTSQSTFSKTPNNRKSGIIKTAKPRSISKSSVSKTRKDNLCDEKPNLQYEIERLLRALYRHSVICPEFKEELRASGGILLLDEYLKFREISN